MGPDDGRAAVLEYMERQLVGPWGGDDELIREPPQRRYLTGILFPCGVQGNSHLGGDIDDETPGSPDEEDDDPLVLSGQLLPSSVGLSFVVANGASVRVEIQAARYLKEGGGWRRHTVEHGGTRAVILRAPTRPGRTREDIPGEDVSLHAVWRRSTSGTLVTVALVNRRSARRQVDPSDCLLQVSVRCAPDRGVIAPYPRVAGVGSDDEEEELALLYRDVPTFAVGHGAAATWPTAGPDGVDWVESSYAPRHEVPSVEFGLPGYEQVLSLTHLTGITRDPGRVVAALDHFVDGYDAWAERLTQDAALAAPSSTPAAERLLGRIQTARLRMRRGVRLLEGDVDVRRAFALANEAVLMQMIRTREPYGGRRRSWTEPVPDAAGYDDPTRSWRPFQLAFLLLTVESVAVAGSPDRDVIDLLWFPTGGGKTEAYLGAVAFAVFHRRLLDGDGGAGVTVITRYTLRLLTAQQFQRAAALVCACEMIRSARPLELGSVPITIGIWVGGDSSPNRYVEAVRLLDQIRNREWTTSSFQLELCPWCGTELLPEDDVPDEAWGVHAGNDSFRFTCPNATCDFHHGLPVSSVDEDLYRNPPTVLIGTVDKFARLTWDERAGVFLGAGGIPGPSLIIQDEFHLISGPLGTVVGLYEAAFDVAMDRNGARPKILASTATIRRADEQAKGVFGRRIELFPPAGLTAEDSYFVRYDRSRQGRLYVGLMPQGHTPLTAMVHMSAALLQAPLDVPLTEPYRDAYWTLVAYHNSLRELGKTVTLAHDDIPARLRVIAEADDGVRALPDDQIIELTSNVPAADITRSLEQLAVPRGAIGSVSFVASTNMISVGVDVSRLGLMLVVGQPKTSAEYVQATSRVGRDSPGLVFALYSPSKPRDRSHYESFVPYHAALYRFVEPTSVTPFSIPARARALHAGLVVLARHARGWAADDGAAAFTTQDAQWAALVEDLLRRVEAADPDEREDVARHVRTIEARWEELVRQAEARGGLRYIGAGKERIALLRRFGRAGLGWPTLDSMRSVDVEVRMRVKGTDQ